MPPESAEGQPQGRRWLLLAGGVLLVAVIAYIWFSRRQGSGNGAVTYAGSGGSARSSTVIDKGAVQIRVTQAQPGPPVHRRTGQVAVPDVVGQKYAQAAEQVGDSGLRAKRATPYVGVVRSEKPRAGTKVKRGSVVTLAGGKKKRDRDKPDVEAA